MAYPQPVITSEHNDTRHDAGRHPSKAVHAHSRHTQSERASTGDAALLKQAQPQLHATQKSQHQHQHQQRYPGNASQMNVSTPNVQQPPAHALSHTQSYPSPLAHPHSPPNQLLNARSHLYSPQHHSQAHLQSQAHATHPAHHARVRQAGSPPASNQHAPSPAYSAPRSYRTQDQPKKDPHHPSPRSHHSGHHHLYATQDRTQNGTHQSSPQTQNGAHQLYRTQDLACIPAHDATPRSHTASALHKSLHSAPLIHLPADPHLHRVSGHAHEHAAKGEDASISARRRDEHERLLMQVMDLSSSNATLTRLVAELEPQLKAERAKVRQLEEQAASQAMLVRTRLHSISAGLVLAKQEAGDCLTACKDAETKREAPTEYRSQRADTACGLEREINVGSRTQERVEAIEISSGHSSPGAGVLIGGHRSAGRGKFGADNPLCSLQNSARSMNSVRRARGGNNEEEVGIGSPRHRETVAAITQLALDIKRHRDIQKGYGDSSPVSRELDLKYMSSAVSADVALMSQRANQLSDLLSAQREYNAEAHRHEGSRGAGQQSRALDKKPPLPPRVSQHEQDRERKSALKNPQGNSNSPHQHPTSLSLAYASPSESISTPRSHVTFQGETWEGEGCNGGSSARRNVGSRAGGGVMGSIASSPRGSATLSQELFQLEQQKLRSDQNNARLAALQIHAVEELHVKLDSLSHKTSAVMGASQTSQDSDRKRWDRGDKLTRFLRTSSEELSKLKDKFRTSPRYISRGEGQNLQRSPRMIEHDRQRRRVEREIAQGLSGDGSVVGGSQGSTAVNDEHGTKSPRQSFWNTPWR